MDKTGETGKTDKMDKQDPMISLIRAIPEDRAPQNLTRDIMARINESVQLNETMEKKENSLSAKLHDLFRKRMTLSFSPAMAVGTAALILLGLFFIPDFWFRNQNIDTSEQVTTASSQVQSPSEAFLSGRALLTQGHLEKAKKQLEKAVEMNPANADYHFWLGVSQGRLKEYKNERSAYLTAITLNPAHFMSFLFLGHSFMNDQKWDQAVNAYREALSIRPGLERALFNQGLALEKAGRTVEAVSAWKDYLAVQSEGIWALRAADHLNEIGDFTYRICQMGKQRIVAGPFSQNPQTGSLMVSEAALTRLSRSLERNGNMDLFVIVNVLDNPEKARSSAITIKHKLLNTFPDIDPARIRLSWFGAPEDAMSGKGSVSLEQSVRFLGLDRQFFNKGVKI